MKRFIIFLVLAAGAFCLSVYLKSPPSPSSRSPSSGSQQGQLSDADSQAARACLDQALGDWQLGKDSPAIPSITNPDGSFVRHPALASYQISVFQTTQSGETCESSVILQFASQAGTPLSVTEHYYVSPNTQTPGTWDITAKPVTLQ